jgi:hypothetical protein
MWLKRHGKVAEQRRVIGLLPLSKRVFLSRMIFTAVCCDRCALTAAFKESPDVMERIQKKGRPMSIWWFIIILGIWILLQAYILPKLGIST